MNNTTLKSTFELSATYDSRKSFYGKAHVLLYSDGSMDLRSYNTIVSHRDSDGHVTHLGTWSRTTTRHQKEFEKQFAM